MEKNKNNFNYLCYTFSSSLTNLINSSNLPVFAIYLLLKETLHEISELKDQTVLSLFQDQEEKEQEVSIPIIEKEKEE